MVRNGIANRSRDDAAEVAEIDALCLDIAHRLLDEIIELTAVGLRPI